MAARIPSARVAEAMLLSMLVAYRDGALAQWLQQHRRVTRWLEQCHLWLVTGTAGDALRETAGPSLAVER